jgi:hypothetical protein
MESNTAYSSHAHSASSMSSLRTDRSASNNSSVYDDNSAPQSLSSTLSSQQQYDSRRPYSTFLDAAISSSSASPLTPSSMQYSVSGSGYLSSSYHSYDRMLPSNGSGSSDRVSGGQSRDRSLERTRIASTSGVDAVGPSDILPTHHRKRTYDEISSPSVYFS